MVVALVVGGIGGMLSARLFIHDRIVTAERFVLIDGENRMRAVLDQDEGGNPRLFFFDDAERAGLFFSDRSRKVRGILGMDNNEEAFLTFLGEDTRRIWRAPQACRALRHHLSFCEKGVMTINDAVIY